MGSLLQQKFDTEIIPRALHLLLDDVPASASQKEALTAYIHEKFAKIGTCILWPRSSELCELMDQLGLSVQHVLGKKEIIITKRSIRFSPNFTSSAPMDVYIA